MLRPQPVNATIQRNLIFGEILDERRRQIAKWGYQSHPHKVMIGDTPRHWEHECIVAKTNCQDKDDDEVTWEDILWEEVTEAFCEEDWSLRRAELIQVMAVCLAEIEDGDLKNLPPLTQESDEIRAYLTGGRDYVIPKRLLEELQEPNGPQGFEPYPGQQPYQPGESEQNAAGGST